MAILKQKHKPTLMYVGVDPDATAYPVTFDTFDTLNGIQQLDGLPIETFKTLSGVSAPATRKASERARVRVHVLPADADGPNREFKKLKYLRKPAAVWLARSKSGGVYVTGRHKRDWNGDDFRTDGLFNSLSCHCKHWFEKKTGVSLEPGDCVKVRFWIEEV